MALCTLLTDFGTRDSYVASVKGTILRLTPDVTLVDITHEVQPGDVATASRLLFECAATFPPRTVHLAVVDPEVGSARDILVAENAGQFFVAPDNGLLTPLFDSGRCHRVERADLYLEGAGVTFHGRDRFAPVAAAMLRGMALADLGPRADRPRRLPEVTPVSASTQEVRGHVRAIDRFGNVITDIPADLLAHGRRFEVLFGGLRIRRRATHYAELEPGEPALIPNSFGTLEISLRGDSMAAASSAESGQSVVIRFVGEQPDPDALS